MSSKFIYCIHVYLTSDDNELLYVLVTDMDFYSLVIGLMVKPYLLLQVTFHFIFPHRKHIQKPVEKLKIVTEIFQEFYSKDVSKYAINKQYKLVNLNLYN